MNKVQYNHPARSFGQIVVMAGLLAPFMPINHSDVSNGNTRDDYVSPYAHNYGSNQSSFTDLASTMTVTRQAYKPNDLDQEVGVFYKRLLDSQEPLGQEFAAILHDNLWDLYES